MSTESWGVVSEGEHGKGNEFLITNYYRSSRVQGTHGAKDHWTHIVGKINFAREMRGHIFVANGEDCDEEQGRHLIASQRTTENQDPNQAVEEVLSCVNKEYHALKIETQIAEVGWNFRETGPMRVFLLDLSSQTCLHSNFEKRFLHYTFMPYSTEDW